MAYTDKTNVENFLNITIPASLNTQLATWIAGVKQWIDNYTGTTFESGSETRYYDGSGSRELLVDYFTGDPVVVTLDVDGDDDVSITADYIDSYPLNETVKNCLVLKSAAEVGVFPKRQKSVKVTATFGWSSTVPELVQMAATQLVAYFLQTRLKGGKNVTSEELGDYSISYGKVDSAADELGIKNILDQYRLFNL